MASHRDGRRMRVLGGLVATVLVLAGLAGYAVADLRGALPGPLTTDPVPLPYPDPGSAPGAAVVPGTPAEVLPGLAADAPLPDAQALTAQLAPLLDAATLGPAVGVQVRDARTGQVLFGAGADGLHEPASTAKVLTATAALATLGGQTTIRTATVLAPGSRHVFLIGAGDVLLAAGTGAPDAVVGRAGLDDLAAGTAEALTAQGITEVDVTVDDSLLGGIGWGESMGPGWSDDDIANGFVAPVTGLAVNGGRLGTAAYSPRVADPGLDAGQAFSQALQAHGVQVSGPALRAAAPSGASALASVQSAPIADLVGFMLATSDNNLAEALSRLVAVHAGNAAGFGSGGAAVLAALAGLGVDTTGATLADGSGLSDGSRVSADLLAATLAAAASPDHPQLRPALDGLALAGLTGTLTDRFGPQSGAETAVGVVRAKTGSLARVTSLAGTVITADGRLLTFAVLADQVPAVGPARQTLDRLAAALAGCGCR